MSYFVENTLMKDPTVPDDEEQVRIGLALIFTDISKEVENIGQEIEFKFPKIQ